MTRFSGTAASDDPTDHKGEDCPFCLRWERIIAATAASDDPKVRSWKDWEEAAYRKHLEEKA